MALQSSGQISFANIINEFGDSGGGLGGYRLNQTIGSLSGLRLDKNSCGPSANASIPGPGQTISFQDFYNARLNVVVDYHTGSTEYRAVAKDKYVANGVTVVGGFRTRPSSTGGIKVFVNVNKKIGSDTNNDTHRAALRTGSWDSGTQLTIDVGGSGKIYGAGGRGGNGTAGNGTNGNNGNTAVGFQFNTTLNVASGGYIQQGYAGGGGGGHRYHDPDKNSRDDLSSGGGGGGGAGLPVGAGGVNTGGAFGNGANGANGSSATETAHGNGGAGGNGGGVVAGSGGDGGDPTQSAQRGQDGQSGPGREVSRGSGGAPGTNGVPLRRDSNSISVTVNNSGSIIPNANLTTGQVR